MNKIINLFSSTLRIAILLLITVMVAVLLISLSGSISDISQHKSNISFNITDYQIDTSNQLSKQQIVENNQFIAPIDNKVPFTLADQTYWIKIEIINHQQDNSLILYADNSLLDEFVVWHQHNKIDVLNHTEQRQAIYPHVPISLNMGEQTTLLLKTRTQGPPSLPIMVLTEQSFQQRILFTQLVYGAFIGIIVLMTLYNLVLYFAVKDKVYLVYICYLLTSFTVLSSITGFGYLIFSKLTMTKINIYLIFSHYCLAISLLAFTLFFLRYDIHNNKTYKVGLTLIFTLLVSAFLSLSLDSITQAKIFFSLQPVIYLFSLFAIFRKLKSNFSWAKYYVLSWCPLLLGAAIQPLVLLNYLEYSFVTRNAFLFGVMAEITLMAFALAERMRRNEQDRITDIAYHISSGLPRKSNIESTINQLSDQKDNHFALLIIKPQQIEKVVLYLDDEMNTALFQRLFTKLSTLFHYNDAVYPLTDKDEKLCFINNNSFAIMLDLAPSEQEIEVLIKSIQQIVNENYQIEQLVLPLTATIGIANFPEHGEKSHQLINHALQACQQASFTNINWSYFENESSDKASYYLKLTSDLRAALENNELSIYHQPQIDLSTLRVCSSECLIRWQHPTEGNIGPYIFIPIAEDMGMITHLTLWVIKQALTQQHIIMNEYGYNHMVSINISGKDVASEHFFSQALDIIEECCVSADKIIFELTESSSLSENKQAMHVIEQFKELGITISIDDFGTGYSTMSQISQLPFQELKVDREFVENVNQDEKRKIIAKTTVQMAKGLGLEVVAEGVNSQEDEDTLRGFGCDIGQGYYYAKPMAFDDYLDWLESLINGRVKQPILGEYIPAKK